MKAVIATFLLVSLALFSAAQATTQTEFNYITKGIAETEEKGLDVKAGYSLTELTDSKLGTNNYVIKVYKLARTKDNTTAGFLFKVTSKSSTLSSERTNYYCMPAPNTKTVKSFGWAEFYQQLSNMDNVPKEQITQYLAYKASIKLASN